MHILILGGTNFIGPHLVEEATSHGHEVTLFNRGKTAPDAFQELEQLRGDRKTGDYAALENGRWDVVIDMCAYWPRAIRETLDALGDRVDHYVFVSTISVYDRFDPDGYDEDAPLATVDDPETEKVGAKNYGGLKVLCEEALDAFESATTIIRPGLVAGPGDPTDRFTYWPARISGGGTALAPGDPTDPIQYIDARDLASFMMTTVNETVGGTFNVVTPRGSYTIGELLTACRQAAESPATLEWVGANFLHDHEVSAWSDLPVWVPPGTPLAGIPHCISRRAVEAGLTFTPLTETVTDTLAWYHDARDDELGEGLSPERERELLDLWSAADD